MRGNIVTWARDNATTIAVFAGVGLLAWIILRSPSKVAEDVGRGVVSVGRGVATGVVDEVGKIVGVPSVYDVTDNPSHARYIIDHPRGGYFRASFYSTPVALAQAAMMDEYSGTLPPADSRIYAEFPPVNGAGGEW